jgi:prenyltransferase beta subunit
MRMSRKIWLVLAVVALLAASFAASVIAAKRAGEDRAKYITRGLDYLHARQNDKGGFGNPENTAMAVLGAVASGERMGNSAWHVKGKNPFDYLQSTDLVAGSTGIDVTNAPVYYSRLILAYVAMDKAGSIGTAGSKGVNLLNILLSYQNTADGPNKGAFAPSLPSIDAAVRTTSWAILAMNNAGVSRTDSRYLMAEAWLAAQQNDIPGSGGNFGGFPSSELGDPSDALDTSLAYQALMVSSNGADWSAADARAYLQSAQRANGGFSATANGNSDAEASSAGIQAILAMGEQPESADWKTASGDTPVSALQRFQQTNGAYKASSTSRVRPVIVTGWSLVALNRKPFGSGTASKVFPKNPGSAHKAFKFRPVFKTISPKNGAKYTTTRVVLIRATYTDFYPKGTGIKPSACRLYVDDVNKSRPADIGKYGLHLQLKNVPNGDHEYRIELRDNAGNAKVIERKFTVNVATPTSSPTPTTRPTIAPNPLPTYPSPVKPSTPTPTPTPTITSSTSPYPYISPTPSPSPIISASPSPSSSPSPAGVGGSGGGGSAGGFVGGTLLAMLPIGAVVSYLLLHRREDLLGTASQGEVLAGGGSAWERFKQTLAKSKDLTRPSSRE